MHKKLIYLIAVATVLFTACDPIEDRDIMSGAVTAEDLDISAVPQVVDGKNSNYIDVNSDGVGCLSSWDYVNGVTPKTKTTVQMVIGGSQDIVFTGLNGDGSQITKTINVQIDTLINVDKEWGYLCGAGEKSWVWNDSVDYIWGNNGYRGGTTPGWWGRTLSDIEDEEGYKGWDANSTMTFSVRGATLTKSTSDGSHVETGSFSFDMSDTILSYGNVWSHGTLYTSGTTILQGISQNDGKIPVYEFHILTLNDDEMVLAYRTRSGGSTVDTPEWNAEAWFWMFKAKE